MRPTMPGSLLLVNISDQDYRNSRLIASSGTAGTGRGGWDRPWRLGLAVAAGADRDRGGRDAD
jgi:hypothetical protein